MATHSLTKTWITKTGHKTRSRWPENESFLSASAYPFPYVSCEAVIPLKVTWPWPHEKQRFLMVIGGAMKKKLEPEEQHQKDLEILKAVAQAWHSHSGSSKPMSEFEAHRRNVTSKPSRFKLEATNKSSTRDTSSAPYWDFQQSLWDSYELVAVSRRIETGLALDNPFDDLGGSILTQRRRKVESKNSLRNLFYRFSSGRFDATKVPQENNT